MTPALRRMQRPLRLLLMAIAAGLPWTARAAINPQIFQQQATEHLLIKVVGSSVSGKTVVVRAKVLKAGVGGTAKVGETILIKWTDPGKPSATPAPAAGPEAIGPAATGPQALSYPKAPAAGATVPAYLGVTCQSASDCFYWPAASQYSFEEQN